VSVCHKPVLYWNGCKDYGTDATSAYPYFTGTELAYLQKWRYSETFPNHGILYTPCSKKGRHQTHGGNSVNSQPIFKIFHYQIYFPVNLQQSTEEWNDIITLRSDLTYLFSWRMYRPLSCTDRWLHRRVFIEVSACDMPCQFSRQRGSGPVNHHHHHHHHLFRSGNVAHTHTYTHTHNIQHMIIKENKTCKTPVDKI